MPNTVRPARTGPRRERATTGHHTAPPDGTTQRLVAAAQGGDGVAMQALYVRYRPTVLGYVLPIVADRHEAEDVTQQVFAKLLTELGRYEPRSSTFLGWLLRVARNTAIDQRRRRRRAIPFAVVRDPERAGGDDVAGACRASLREALGTLPPGQRDVLLLRHLLGLSPQEIARRTGRSVGAVHGLHHRGRAAARVALHDLGAGPATTC